MGGNKTNNLYILKISQNFNLLVATTTITIEKHPTIIIEQMHGLQTSMRNEM